MWIVKISWTVQWRECPHCGIPYDPTERKLERLVGRKADAIGCGPNAAYLYWERFQEKGARRIYNLLMERRWSRKLNPTITEKVD